MYFILNKISHLPQHGMSPAGGITMLLLQPGPHRFGYNSPVFLPLSIFSYQSQTTNYTAPSYANVPGIKVHIPHNIPGIFLQAFVVLSRQFHILHQEDNTVMYWSDRTEYASCFFQVESAVRNRRIPIQSVGFHILFPENYGKTSIQAVPLKPFLFSFFERNPRSFLRLFNKIPRLEIRFLLLFFTKEAIPQSFTTISTDCLFSSHHRLISSSNSVI